MTFGLIQRGGAFVATVLLASGCYVDSAPQDRATTGGNNTTIDTTRESDAGLCRWTISKGCFDGYVIAQKDFSVDGKQFFNADDLSAHFAELVPVDGKDYSIVLATQLDNQSFVQGFEYVLKGELVRKDKIRTNGSFSINELPEGQYDLRVLRAVRFTVSHQVAKAETQPVAPLQSVAPATTTSSSTPTGTQASGPGATQTDAPATAPAVTVAPKVATETVAKVYCATIYADTTIDVRRGKRATPETFTDFRLHVTDAECEAAGSSATIKLD